MNYVSGDGFVSREVWAGAEINPEPCHDHLFSPPADGQAAAPRAMGAPQRGKRLWSQISKAGPSFPVPTTQTTQRQRTRPKSPKLSRSIPPRRQREDAPAQVGGSSGSGDESFDALKEGRIRRTHNLVEKQYRNRLNAQFERLLAVLPAESESQEEQREEGYVPDKTISKAEVLGMATRRIKTLEQQNLELLLHQGELMWNLEAMGGAAAASCINAVLGQPPS